MKKIFLFINILLCSFCWRSLNATEALASPPGNKPPAGPFPEPGNIQNMMFYIQRDPNTNTIVYELNQTESGKLNEQEPIHMYWIRYAEGGEVKELNYIQRKFAYGLHARKLARDNFELRFVSYHDLALYLRKTRDGKFQVFTTINRQEAILDNIYVRIEGGTFWVPKVLYVELKGREVSGGKILRERFVP